MVDNKNYYDKFAKAYDTPRHGGYHALIDDLEFQAVLPFCRDARVLEAGCGTGLVMDRLRSAGIDAWGIDLSAGMLKKAAARGLRVSQADILKLPFEDNSFDCVVSFKVLAHVEPIQAAVDELIRVTRSGGYLALEFYNPYSLRGFIKKLKKPTATSEQFSDEDITTRYDSPARIRSYAGASCRFIGFRGIRVFTPVAAVHTIPVIGGLFRFLEHASIQTPLARFGGFVIGIYRKL